MLPLVVSGTMSCVAVGKVAELRGTYKSSCVIASIFQMLGAGLFLSITPHTHVCKVYVYQCILGILGIGAGGVTAIGNTIALHGVPKSQFARPVTWINWILNLAAAIGIVVQGALFDQRLVEAVKELTVLFPDLADVHLDFSSFLGYIKSASPNSPILLIARKYATLAQKDGSCLFFAVGVLCLAASITLPNESLLVKDPSDTMEQKNIDDEPPSGLSCRSFLQIR